MAAALPQASLAQVSLLLHTPLTRGISCRGSPPVLGTDRLDMVGALTPLVRGGISCRGSPPAFSGATCRFRDLVCSSLRSKCLDAFKRAENVFCRAGRINDPTCIDSIDREAMEAFYQKRNADFLKGLAELSDMFVEPSNLSETLKLIRRGGARELVIFDSDEELAAATNGHRFEDLEETIILGTDKDRFVPVDFTNNEELYTLLDESS